MTRYRCIATVKQDGMILKIHRGGTAVRLTGKVGGISFEINSPSPTSHGLMLIGIGCALKEDERFRPIYEAMKDVAEKKTGSSP